MVSLSILNTNTHSRWADRKMADAKTSWQDGHPKHWAHGKFLNTRKQLEHNSIFHQPPLSNK